MSRFYAAPLSRGEASAFCERGVYVFENQPPVRFAHAPLNRGAA